MELREPRRKRRVPVKCQQPFPLPIKNFTEEVIFNGVSRSYSGQYSGNNVIVSNPEDMTALSNMGFFGKGSLSRSAPTFGKWKMNTPPLIFNRQWKRRCEWANRSEKTVGEDGEEGKSNEKEKQQKGEIADESSNCVQSVKEGERDVTVKSEIKMEVVELDKSVALEHNIKSEPNTVPPRVTTVSVDSKSKNITDCGEVDSKQGQTVIVLADSDCDSGDEDYLLNLNPRLEQEEFPIQESLQLTFEEAFFLTYGLGCLQVSDMLGNELSIMELWKLFQQSQSDFVQKYVVYHYFRSKGWVVKPGIKFGGDFLLYKQGPAFYHASYIVHIRVVSVAGMPEPQDKRTFSWTQYIGYIRLAETAGKEVLLCNVVWPLGVSRTEILNSPKVLEKFTVQEVLLRRWVSSQEREELEKEEIMD